MTTTIMELNPMPVRSGHVEVRPPVSDPVRQLVARLQQLDGQLWLALMLDTGPTSRFGSPRRALCAGHASLEQMRVMKAECKRYLKTSADQEIRLGALCAYVMVVAAALVHYGRLICNRTRAELEPMFLDLAEVAPREWSILLMQAVVVPPRADRN